MENDRSASEVVPLPPCPSCFYQCGTRNVSGIIFVMCFLFPFPAILHFMCIYCVISIHIRYFPVYVWLLVMYHWLSVPNTGRSALFALRPVYACTSHVQQPLYCFWCVSSCVTVTETRFFAILDPFCKMTAFLTTLRASCQSQSQQKIGIIFFFFFFLFCFFLFFQHQPHSNLLKFEKAC